MIKISIVIILVGLISVVLELLAIVTMFGIASDTWQFSMISLILGIGMFTLAVMFVLMRLEQDRIAFGKSILDKIPLRKVVRRKKLSKKSVRKKKPLKNLAMNE
ncbi:hypothetical protein AYK25_03260 [Thermoplasmatales archaeon SM1-50]|nr:MAG: hypothetical protein AYK25_03260 [Thermoplasmatales archaeon SM1-50]